jgi:carbonic anhydrase/acetyltransferase-like protein (isoleucine patch superfamily)
MPRIAPDAFIADGAVITGDVEVGPGASVWYGVVIRGDSSPIRIGARSNIQDGTIIHSDADAPTSIGADVTVGHRAIVHGATVGDGALIGMGAILLSHSRIGAGAIVGAGALVPERGVVEAHTLVMGVPARPRRALSNADAELTVESARHYHELGKEYQEAQAQHRGKQGG